MKALKKLRCSGWIPWSNQCLYISQAILIRLLGDPRKSHVLIRLSRQRLGGLLDKKKRNCEELTHLKTTLLWRAAYCVGGESHRRSRRHNPVSQPLRSFFFPLSLLCEVNIQILTPFISSINWLSWQVLFVSLLLLSPSSSWNLVRAREGMIRKTCGGGVWRMTACCNIG